MTLEKRRQKFINLAENRVNKAIKHLHLIGNLANRSNYSYSQDDADRICNTLQAELKLLRTRFQNGTNDEPKFKLEL